ncbi:uncharacterized protein N7459_000411 [Penicillium hispanicum]|uniref:uncharacterized protein n=1 Tax=Penicillium hispanicum TaxID=1080232 RepID=UPI00254132C4|nr:uncharacterized protein N7459_000411 [Penicillium hispanicum]KAJ5594203.1 hypothetical protein N7459_000411 [Penicillium hispanicum]
MGVPSCRASAVYQGCIQWLLATLIIVGLVRATPASQDSNRPSQVYQTTDQFPLPNLGNVEAHDPNILLWEDHYYLFKGGVNIPIQKAANLSGPWEQVGTVLDGESVIHQGNRSHPWAPTAIERNGTLYCFYSLSSTGSRNSAIGVATTTSLDGHPWTDHGALIRTGQGNGSHIWPFNITNAIDPSFITDQSTGKPYLVYGSFWDDVWQIPLADDLLSVEDPEKPDAVQLTFLLGQQIRPEEGSWMSYHDGYYYTWFSHGKCCNFENGFPDRGDEYSIRVGRSKHVRGPFFDRNARSLLDGGGTVVYGSNHGLVYAPGGLGVLPGNNSVPDVLYYHYLNTSIGFAFEEAHLGWNYLQYDDGWPVVLEGTDHVNTTSAASISALPSGLSFTTLIVLWLYIWVS